MLGWVGLTRLRGRGFAGLPRWAGFAMIALAPLALVGAIAVPSLVWPTPLAALPGVPGSS